MGRAARLLVHGPVAEYSLSHVDNEQPLLPGRWRDWFHQRDLAAFQRVAERHWPGAEHVLPRLSRSANHGLLWVGAAAGMAALGSSARSRRAALRGIASLAVASAAINTVGKERCAGSAR